MKLAILLGLFSCLQIALAACPDCQSQTPVYNILECKSACKKGSCITGYSCAKILHRYRAVKRKCYFNYNYYDLGFVLPRKYPSSNGRFLCDYRCSKIGKLYYFLPINCIRIFIIPAPHICLVTVELYGPLILYNNYALIYRPAICYIRIIRVPVVQRPPSNCLPFMKCCKVENRLYKKGTIIPLPGGVICVCSCPPIMICN